MEGPTPVSALIHAATMVTAGVYMVARCTPLFHRGAESQDVVAVIGGFTALLAGVDRAHANRPRSACWPIPRSASWATCFWRWARARLAGIAAGMFHLFTHAFFKALLFLGAGSVMHAMGGVIDMRRFSGLRRLMPTTFLDVLVRLRWPWRASFPSPVSGARMPSSAPSAISGATHRSTTSCFGPSLFTAFLTAFYTFRGLFLTFYGRERVPARGGASRPRVAFDDDLSADGAGRLCVGDRRVFEWHHTFAHFLGSTPSLAYAGVQTSPEVHAPHEHASHLGLALFSTVVALSGVGLAAFFYLGDRRQIEQLTRLMQLPFGLKLYQLSQGKFYIDAIYGLFIVWPLRDAGHGQLLVRPVGDRRIRESLRPGADCLRRACCVRCSREWCSSTPWSWCWERWY